MKIRLFSADRKLCVLDGGEVPKGFNRHLAAHQIVDFFRDGEWIWVDSDKRAIRYDSITSIEIVPEGSVEDLSEKASAD